MDVNGSKIHISLKVVGKKRNLIKMCLEFYFSSVYIDFTDDGLYISTFLRKVMSVYNLRLNDDILFHQIFVLESKENVIYY